MKKRDLTFKPELESIIQKCDYCSLAMVDRDGYPYVVPMNFGYAGDHIYFHSARQGKKIDILKENPRVCVSFSTDHELRWVNEEVACSWGMKYRSVLAYGEIEFIDDYDGKLEALKTIMKNYSDHLFLFNAPAVNDVMIYRVKVDKLVGRCYGY
ncbi:MAG: pyridoxamine 5'-phosphate oxidase family protein [Bacteroidales bacterium]|nr:pyridoxamine 5'-phosphate oxidase family protein [Bacteroidales bacterium]